MRNNQKVVWGFIYLFIVCNKGYVGQTPYLKNRFKCHFKIKKSNSYFHNSLRKYFKENSSFEILECWKRNERSLEEFKKLLNNREIFWIDKLGTFDPEQKKGWNLTRGGGGILGLKGKFSPNWNKKLSIETRRKISENHANMSGMNNPCFGRTKEKHPFFGKRGSSTYYFGKHHTKETKNNISKKTRGENNGSVKLTEKEVIEIKNSSLSQIELGKIYKIHQSHVSRIKRNVNWKYL